MAGARTGPPRGQREGAGGTAAQFGGLEIQLGGLEIQCGGLGFQCGELGFQCGELGRYRQRGLRGRGLLAEKRGERSDECGDFWTLLQEKADEDSGGLRLQAREVGVAFARTCVSYFPRYLLLALLAVFRGDVEELGDFLVAEVEADQGEVAEFARRQCGVGIDEAHEEGNVHLLEIGGEIAPFFR